MERYIFRRTPEKPSDFKAMDKLYSDVANLFANYIKKHIKRESTYCERTLILSNALAVAMDMHVKALMLWFRLTTSQEVEYDEKYTKLSEQTLNDLQDWSHMKMADLEIQWSNIKNPDQEEEPQA